MIDCLYCGTVNAASDGATSQAPDAAWEARKQAITAFTEALVLALNEGRAPFDALRAASAAHLGIAGRADTVARIALALARDFERESGASVVRDPVVFSRIAQAYLLALDELRTSETYDLNLPFLTATERGPAHLQRTLTAKLLAELAARDPNVTAPNVGAPSAPATSTVEPVPKKRGWWPF